MPRTLKAFDVVNERTKSKAGVAEAGKALADAKALDDAKAADLRAFLAVHPVAIVGGVAHYLDPKTGQPATATPATENDTAEIPDPTPTPAPATGPEGPPSAPAEAKPAASAGK